MRYGNINMEGNIDMNQGSLTAIGLNGRDGADILGKSTTEIVSFNNSMSVGEMQALINSKGKYLKTGITLIFDFTDGTYSFGASTLKFEGFQGPGILVVADNNAVTTARTTQSVTLDYTGANYPIMFRGCTCAIQFQAIKITVGSSTWAGILVRRCSEFYSSGCYIVGSGTRPNEASFVVQYSRANITQYYVNTGNKAIKGDSLSYIVSSYGYTTGTNQSYGLYASGSAIMKGAGSQPTGSIANEFSSIGGVIR